MKRRSFILASAQTAFTIAIGKSTFSSVLKHNISLGLLLGTVEKYMIADPAGTLEKVASIGFKELEYPHNYACDAGVLKKIIKKNRLSSLGGGENITHLANNFGDYVSEYNKMGKKYVFCYWPWFDAGLNKTIDDWKKQAGIINELGEKYRKEGLRLAYHNHNIEFAETENQIPYDILITHTNPEFVTFQMDIWWVRKGGQMPLDFIEKYPGRFEVCHIKTKGLIEGNEEVKDLDYKKVLAQSSKAGFRHFILENEPGIAEPFTYFKKSFDLMNSYFK